MLGMSQEGLGEQLAVTFQQIQKYEKGTNRISASRLYEVSKIFDVPVDYFFDGLPEDDDGVPPGMAEGDAPSVSPYISFVSSAEGLQLNQNFLQIGSASVRRDILNLVEDLAKVIRLRR